MKRGSWSTTSAELICVLSIAAHVADKVQPLNVKFGLWEVTTTATTTGGNLISPEMLRRFTPEQRARIEERMRATSGTRTFSHKTCITQQKLESGLSFIEGHPSCPLTVVSSTSTRLELKRSCENGGMKSNGNIQVEVLNAESVKGSSHLAVTGGGQRTTTNSTYAGKWIGAACGSVK